MTLPLRRGRSPQLGLAVALVLLPSLVWAAERGSRVPKFGEFNPDHQTVEMFSAIAKGDIEVKLIPKDSTQCRVMIENKTKQPLNIKLPEAFAGVPVLAQPGFGGAGMGGGGNNFGGGQGMGGGMGMGGGGMGGMGMGMMNVPPEKVGKLEVTTVCLEHGKPEPRPNMQYEIKPIGEFTDKAEVRELCRMLGTGRIDQRAAQVAAWHLNNEMSWQELAAKQLRRANGISRPYFSPMELQAGMQISAMATAMAEQRKKSPGEDDTLSRN
ncbi:MAG TPA: hypothetical protein VMY42_02080 [Thermoguttaceae bacterium]|nr:hypothetical protein [Thermoguttaceae bacterium]